MTPLEQSTHRRLSIAIIARNAEQLLPATLDSVRELADEIILVDTGSSDRTRDIARRRATKLVECDWEEDFSAARNAAFASLTGDWALWLDAGETLPRRSAAELREFVDRSAKKACGYLLTVTCPAPGGGIEQAARLRLLPLRPDVRFFGRVREQIRFEPRNGVLEVRLAPGLIERGPRELDPETRRERGVRNLRLARLEEQDDGPCARLAVVQGEAWLALNQPEQAAAAFHRAVKLAERGSTEMLEAYYGWLTAYDSWPERREEQLAVATAALDVYPLDAQLLAAVGNYLQLAGRLDLAARSFQTAVEHGQVNIETWHLANIVEVAAGCWSRALELLGQPEQALELLETLAARPHPAANVLRQLLDLHIQHDRRQAAFETARRLPLSPLEHEMLRGAIRGACLAARRNWAGALPYLQSAYEAGCRDPLCFRWLCAAFCATKDWSAAERCLAEWRRTEPHSGEMRRLERICRESQPAQPQPCDHCNPTDVSTVGKIQRVDPNVSPPRRSAPITLVQSPLLIEELMGK